MKTWKVYNLQTIKVTQTYSGGKNFETKLLKVCAKKCIEMD